MLDPNVKLAVGVGVAMTTNSDARGSGGDVNK